MRNRAGWHDELLSELNNGWPKDLVGFRAGDLLDIELALYLREHVMPTRAAADVWTLLGGYPYSEAFGDVHTMVLGYASAAPVTTCGIATAATCGSRGLRCT